MLTFTDQRLRQRDFLLRLSRAMAAELDLAPLLELVIGQAVELLAGNYGLIALQGQDERLHIRVSVGIDKESWPLFEPFLASLREEGVDAPRVREELRTVAEALDLPLRQAIALPLRFGVKFLGLIVVFRAAINVAFSTDDRQLLSAFADHAAIAVHNAQLYEQALAEKQRLNSIIEHSADGVMILDSRWRIVAFNRAMEQLTGWPREEAIGRPCAEVLAIENDQGVNICLTACPLQCYPEDPNPVVEGWITTRDGRRRYIANSYSPTRDVQGRFLGAIANVHDLTARKQEEELQLTFISVMSHELKTPVSIIKGYADMLNRPDANWDRQTMREGLQVIEEEADRLGRLINDLLEVSRLQAGGLRLELTVWDLPLLVEKIVRAFAAQVGDQFEFQLRFPVDLPPVHADYERIRMVLTNLVSNAIKYSPEGGTIRIGGWRAGDQVLVYVSDQGVGIQPEDLPYIFDRFYRVDNRLTRETQGTGLGLYLTKAIVEAHGGRIWAESTPGRGSRFFFTLPAGPRPLPGDGEVLEQSAPQDEQEDAAREEQRGENATPAVGYRMAVDVIGLG
ncbi:MAG: histidine kinase [Herpetosiphonaceae bacterium]|nr:MAG: histidine kinase [Herpetosiphonaceae bacterium]